MKHRSATSVIPVHQRVRRARGLRLHPEAARDGLNEGGLPRPEVALERQQGARRERPAERLAFGPKLSLGELANHAWRRSRGAGPRRTSGAASALSSLT